ncbi:MAG: cation diffusion facilitator family transporter [Hyphomicrobiales bacterium]|nr:cation diffusion facilitator family transporter [Hyphomicrobiales bacterium]
MNESHSHAHSHPGSASANRRRVGIAALITFVFMVAEVIGGLLSGSLALLADAGHMITDVLALGLAWFAFRLADRPADGSRTYGYHRFQVLVAFANGLALFVIAGWIIYEAIERIAAPEPIVGGLMLVVAIAGMVANVASFLILHSGDRNNLNMRAAMLHVLGDLLGSAAAIVAALVILATGWTPIDPIVSVLVAVIILRSAWRVVLEAGHILVEGTPAGFDTKACAKDLVATVPDVCDVHHVHVWSLTQERPMATLHVRIERGADADQTVRRIKQRLREAFQIDHATVEIERDGCADEMQQKATAA